MDNNFPLLVVGLGNPGREYEKTRHNIGAYVAYYFAMAGQVSFKEMSKLEGFIGSGLVDGRKVIFLIPTTFMNLSGRSVRKCMDYYKVPLSNVLILSDDTYLDFADVRVKSGGSAGGHNGLKNIELTLGTKDYARLRIGIGEKTVEDLADYVLQPFTKEEEIKMDDIVKSCIHEIKTKILSAEKH